METHELMTQAQIDMPDPPPPADEPPATGGSSLMRVTVNLTPRAHADLQKVAEKTRMSRTDVVNRAVQVYALVEQLMEECEGHLTVVVGGETRKIYIV